jgi:hypothetical protein
MIGLGIGECSAGAARLVASFQSLTFMPCRLGGRRIGRPGMEETNA